jgi:hypothetical protein
MDLTSEDMPPPSIIRPLKVLEKCLDHVPHLTWFEFVTWTDYWPSPILFGLEDIENIEFGTSLLKRALEHTNIETVILTLCFSLVPLSATSLPFSYSLSTLTLKFSFTELKDVADEAAGGRSGLWGPFGSIGSLKPCHKLCSLEIAPELLLGWEDDKQDSGIPLEDLLPDSLQVLQFRMDFIDWPKSAWGFWPGHVGGWLLRSLV